MRGELGLWSRITLRRANFEGLYEIQHFNARPVVETLFTLRTEYEIMRLPRDR